MDINIIYFSGNNQAEKISNAVKIMNDIQSHFTFRLRKDLQLEICKPQKVDWCVFRNTQLPSYNSHIIYITGKAFSDNWFSHEEAQYAVLSINGWDKNFAPIPIELYLIYQIAQAAINFSAKLSEQAALRMTHKDARGCMFDQCTVKRDIVRGMAAGMICDDCKRHLQNRLPNKDALIAVQQMLNYIKISIAEILPATI